MMNNRSFKMETIFRNGSTATSIDSDSLPDPQVLPKPANRKLTTEYKVGILQEVEAYHDRGAIGTPLRREGLYSSSLTAFSAKKEDFDRHVLAAIQQHNGDEDSLLESAE